MKINWGTGIAIFYTTFMVVMVTFVIKSREVDHSLVIDNYYEKDLDYQKHMDKLANAKLLDKDLIISQDEEGVTFQFPKDMTQPSGEILFYRPSDNSKDLLVQIQAGIENNLLVRTKKMLPGLWRVKVDWKANGKAYYKEQVITI